jgi:hypothetical protein
LYAAAKAEKKIERGRECGSKSERVGTRLEQKMPVVMRD